jgi:hypothetical protein
MKKIQIQNFFGGVQRPTQAPAGRVPRWGWEKGALNILYFQKKWIPNK